MERFHRDYKLHQLLSSRKLPVPHTEIERVLECSRATANRVIDEMRNYGAPSTACAALATAIVPVKRSNYRASGSPPQNFSLFSSRINSFLKPNLDSSTTRWRRCAAVSSNSFERNISALANSYGA